MPCLEVVPVIGEREVMLVSTMSLRGEMMVIWQAIQRRPSPARLSTMTWIWRSLSLPRLQQSQGLRRLSWSWRAPFFDPMSFDPMSVNLQKYSRTCNADEVEEMSDIMYNAIKEATLFVRTVTSMYNKGYASGLS